MLQKAASLKILLIYYYIKLKTLVSQCLLIVSQGFVFVMKVIDKLRQGATFSIEIEPPQLGNSIKNLEKILDPLIEKRISFVDITYHAEEIIELVSVGNCSIPIARIKKPGTAGVAGFIKAKYSSYGVEPVPHVIGTRFTSFATEEFLVELSYVGVENVLVLRGDAPRDKFKNLIPGNLRHANDRKSTRLNSSHSAKSRMPSSA